MIKSKISLLFLGVFLAILVVGSVAAYAAPYAQNHKRDQDRLNDPKCKHDDCPNGDWPNEERPNDDCQIEDCQKLGVRHRNMNVKEG